MQNNNNQDNQQNFSPQIKEMKGKTSLNSNPPTKSKSNNRSIVKKQNPSLPKEIQISPKRRNLIYAVFLLSNLFLNYDTGVIPVSLLEIINEVNLDYKEQALLGSLVYLGLSFASIFVSLIFSKFGPSKVCCFMLLLNTCCCFLFSFSYYKSVLFTSRFFMGFTGAFIVIYGPVWVNNYSPPEHSSKWLGILHCCCILGVVLGYLIAGLIINFLNNILSWRFAFQLQGILQFFFALFFFFEKNEYINVNLDKVEVDEEDNDNLQFNIASKSSKQKVGSRIDSIETSNLGKYCHEAKKVLTNPLYMTITFGLCSIYFIVTGIQFWMTAYLIRIIEMEHLTVVICVSITSVTAPLFGVIMGGIFADKYGGYKGKNSVKAMKLICAFGFVSFVFAFPLGFLFSFVYIITLLWTFLFFGAAIIPVSTGIMISCVGRDCQATSSSLSQLMFNTLGFFFAPILTGYIMDCFKDKKQGFIWGMRVVFWWVIFSLIFFLLSFIIVYKKYTSDVKELVEEDEEMEEDMDEVMQLEIRRRLAKGLF